MQSVIWRDSSGRTVNELKGGNAWWNEMTDWVGASYRYDDDTLWVLAPGGDHDPDNAVYKLDIKNAAVSRELGPTTDIIAPLWDPASKVSYYTDTQGKYGPAGWVFPSSSHSYNGIVHIEGTNYIFFSAPYVQNGSSPYTMLYDTVARKWQLQDLADGQGQGETCATFDRTGNRVLAMNWVGIYEWVVSRPMGQRKKILSTWGGQDTLVRFHTCRVDEKRRRLYVVGVVDTATGASESWYFDLRPDGSIGPKTKLGSLPTWIAAYGFDIDTVGDRAALYGGGDTIYWLNLDTGAITQEKTLNPPPTNYANGGGVINSNGTFGRMRFSKNLRAVVFLQDMFSGAWIYAVK